MQEDVERERERKDRGKEGGREREKERGLTAYWQLQFLSLSAGMLLVLAPVPPSVQACEKLTSKGPE